LVDEPALGEFLRSMRHVDDINDPVLRGIASRLDAGLCWACGLDPLAHAESCPEGLAAEREAAQSPRRAADGSFFQERPNQEICDRTK
jgi:hypothetical protein